MKSFKFYALILLLASLLLQFTVAFARPVAVKGYYKKNGTYVAPHYRSSPDRSLSNNWSTVGNVNPYTGTAGTKNLDSTPATSGTSEYPSVVSDTSRTTSDAPVQPAVENASSSGIYTLYRTSVGVDTARIHVATFDAADGPAYNSGNCQQARHLFQSQQGVTTRFWCEYGMFQAQI